ncbi:hypothetical protein [Mucilaginibacter sp.]
MPKGLDYIINIKDGDFGGVEKAKSEVTGMDDAVQQSHEHFGSLKEIIGEVGTAIAGAFAIEQLMDFGKESLSIYRSTAAAEAQIVAGIKSTANVAGLSLDDLRDKAEELEHKTLFTQAQTEQAEAIQLTFTNIRGAIFNEALPAIEDLATRMGGDGPADLKGAALQLDKALQDPIKGITALHRVGVSFSDAQKNMIDMDVKHGQVQKAQSIILQELQTEFGGSAEAARSVLGPAGDLDEQMDELKKGFGQFIDESLRVVIPMLLETAEWFTENKEVIGDISTVVAFGAGAWAIYEGALLGVSAVTAVYNGYLAVSNGLAAVGLFYDVARADGMGVLTASQWALNVAMEANPIGLIITAVGAFVGVIYEAYEHSETFRAILGGIGEIAEELVPVFKGLGEIILGALTFDPSEVVDGFKEAYSGVQKVIADGGIAGAFNKGFDASIAASHKADADQAKKDADAKKGVGTATGLVTPGTTPDSPYSINTGKGGKGGGAGNGSTSLSGGRSVRNVTVTIGKLVEKMEVHVTTLTGLKNSDLKRAVTELLTESVHDSELALGSQ